MSELVSEPSSEPPPRPSTARVTAAPMAALRDLPRPRLITVSFWCWMAGSLVIAGTAALQSTKAATTRAELARLARVSDPAATQATVDRVADVSVLLILGTGAILGIVGLALAGPMRTGRNWARFTLALCALIALVYSTFLATAMTGAMVGGARMVVTVCLLTYAAAVTAALICMFVPGTGSWFRRPRKP